MSQRFYEVGEGTDKTYHFTNDDFDVLLDEENLFANLHEATDDELQIIESQDSVYDRVAVLDPIDGKWIVYWRYDLGDEKFRGLEFITRKVGRYLCGHTVLQGVRDEFDQMHQFSDDDFSHLLELPHGTVEG